MPDVQDPIRQEAVRILSVLEAMPFEDCCPLSREFNDLPDCPGIYAVKYRNVGIVYVGKSGNVKSRFRGGHKVLGWALLEQMSPDDIRIAVVTLAYQWNRVSLQLERIIIQQLKPPYNVRIAQED